MKENQSWAKIAWLCCATSVWCGASCVLPGEPYRVEGTLDEGGGSVTAVAGPIRGAQLTVVAGAVSRSTLFGIEGGRDADRIPAGFSAAGPMITMTPEGASFDRSVIIVIPCSTRPSGLYTRPRGGTTWSEVPDATWDAAAGAMTARVWHFSDFIALAGGSDAGVVDSSVQADATSDGS